MRRKICFLLALVILLCTVLTACRYNENNGDEKFKDVSVSVTMEYEKVEGENAISVRYNVENRSDVDVVIALDKDGQQEYLTFGEAPYSVVSAGETFPFGVYYAYATEEEKQDILKSINREYDFTVYEYKNDSILSQDSRSVTAELSNAA